MRSTSDCKLLVRRTRLITMGRSVVATLDRSKELWTGRLTVLPRWILGQVVIIYGGCGFQLPWCHLWLSRGCSLSIVPPGFFFLFPSSFFFPPCIRPRFTSGGKSISSIHCPLTSSEIQLYMLTSCTVQLVGISPVPCSPISLNPIDRLLTLASTRP